MDYRKAFGFAAKKKAELASRDPALKGGQESEAEAASEIEQCRRRLAELQPVLYAENKRALLVVLQGLDAAGKDGTIAHVLSGLNPQGTRVAAFKEPTPEEKAHDFLWRVHAKVPKLGEIVVFNRSHYEDVLVPLVHGTIDREACEKRYREIRHFEAMLARNGTHILKFFLHISASEQLARFAKRIEDPERNWKISAADFAERPFFGAYMAAYEEAIEATNRKRAPWYVIPADHKWFRNLAISQIIAATLAELGMTYPPPSENLDLIRRSYQDAVHASIGQAQPSKKKG